MEVSPHVLDIIKHFSINESKLYNIKIGKSSNNNIYIKFTSKVPDKLEKIGLFDRTYLIMEIPHMQYWFITIHSRDIIQISYFWGQMYYIGNNSVYCSGSNNGNPDNAIYNLTPGADMILLQHIQDNLQCFSCKNRITIKKINDTLYIDGHYIKNKGNIHHICS
jgi:hypothetical protein